MSEVRIPTQQRSIEKRNKIIEVGFKLICEKGYHNITTNDIAREAGISVGIIYQYFNDKKDILLAGINNYSDNLMFPLIDVIDNFDIKNNSLEDMITIAVDKMIEAHTLSKDAHMQLMALSQLDDDIQKIFNEKEDQTNERIVKFLNDNNYKIDNIHEKVHISMDLIDTLCHDVVYLAHGDINSEVMKKEVIKIITSILS